MAKKVFYTIHYPFTNVDPNGFYIDLDSDKYKAIKSDLMHLIFTPKGVRYMLPNFGTNLMKQIFTPNDNITWNDIKVDIQTNVSEFLPTVTITTLEILPSEDGRGVNIKIGYDIDEGTFIVKDEIDYEV